MIWAHFYIYFCLLYNSRFYYQYDPVCDKVAQVQTNTRRQFSFHLILWCRSNFNLLAIAINIESTSLQSPNESVPKMKQTCRMDNVLQWILFWLSILKEIFNWFCWWQFTSYFVKCSFKPTLFSYFSSATMEWLLNI